MPHLASSHGAQRNSSRPGKRGDMAKLNWSPWMGSVTVKLRKGQAPESVGHAASRRHEYSWQPGMDVYESAAGVLVQVELPGISKDDMGLEIEGRTLCIHGERRMGKEAGDGVFHILERAHGPFVRKVELPEGLDLSAVRAVLRDGVLSVSVPRAAEGAGRRILIDE